MGRQELGDWQTPLDLAAAALDVVVRRSRAPATVVEPTCGKGAFLVAAKERFPRADLLGLEIDPRYAEAARAALGSRRATVETADFFDVDWEAKLRGLREPILVAGNPPWVTSAVLGVLGSSNAPVKTNFKRMRGIDALTGKSNFDISEWMLLRLVEALQGRDATLAVLCKTAVARRVIEHAAARGWSLSPGALHRIDAHRHFRASVDAVLFVADVGGRAGPSTRWPVYETLEDGATRRSMALVNGALVADLPGLARTSHLAGSCEPEWRSGLKHDCARVMELVLEGDELRNGLGERVDVESEHVFPMLKSSDVANPGLERATRAMIVPQRVLGEDTARLARSAPRLFRYLTAHRALLRARKSSIYRGQPDFAVFGVGPYTFAPWKVAVSGLYKRYDPVLLGPRGGKPVVLDDTCYFLPFGRESEARAVWRALRSAPAREFFEARIFWDAKRPIKKAILQQVDLDALLR
ncbi:MAG: SAM-dependent DNA methyltransferase [Deltaproteobacteria bacterium]|nr:SAM-dependent DNA methyltransferase [Deltaproteobacteria bacterium]